MTSISSPSHTSGACLGPQPLRDRQILSEWDGVRRRPQQQQQDHPDGRSTQSSRGGRPWD